MKKIKLKKKLKYQILAGVIVALIGFGFILYQYPTLIIKADSYPATAPDLPDLSSTIPSYLESIYGKPFPTDFQSQKIMIDLDYYKSSFDAHPGYNPVNDLKKEIPHILDTIEKIYGQPLRAEKYYAIYEPDFQNSPLNEFNLPWVGAVNRPDLHLIILSGDWGYDRSVYVHEIIHSYNNGLMPIESLEEGMTEATAQSVCEQLGYDYYHNTVNQDRSILSPPGGYFRSADIPPLISDRYNAATNFFLESLKKDPNFIKKYREKYKETQLYHYLISSSDVKKDFIELILKDAVSRINGKNPDPSFKDYITEPIDKLNSLAGLASLPPIFNVMPDQNLYLDLQADNNYLKITSLFKRTEITDIIYNLYLFAKPKLYSYSKTKLPHFKFRIPIILSINTGGIEKEAKKVTDVADVLQAYFELVPFSDLSALGNIIESSPDEVKISSNWVDNGKEKSFSQTSKIDSSGYQEIAWNSVLNNIPKNYNGNIKVNIEGKYTNKKVKFFWRCDKVHVKILTVKIKVKTICFPHLKELPDEVHSENTSIYLKIQNGNVVANKPYLLSSGDASITAIDKVNKQATFIIPFQVIGKAPNQDYPTVFSDVMILDKDGNEIRKWQRSDKIEENKDITYSWDYKNQSGQLADSGPYTAYINLHSKDNFEQYERKSVKIADYDLEIDTQKSTIIIDKNEIKANNKDNAVAIVTLIDKKGKFVFDHEVKLFSSRSKEDKIEPISTSKTNSKGEVKFKIYSQKPGNTRLKAKVGDRDIILTSNPEIKSISCFEVTHDQIKEAKHNAPLKISVNVDTSSEITKANLYYTYDTIKTIKWFSFKYWTAKKVTVNLEKSGDEYFYTIPAEHIQRIGENNLYYSVRITNKEGKTTLKGNYRVNIVPSLEVIPRITKTTKVKEPLTISVKVKSSSSDVKNVQLYYYYYKKARYGWSRKRAMVEMIKSGDEYLGTIPVEYNQILGNKKIQYWMWAYSNDGQKVKTDINIVNVIE